MSIGQLFGVCKLMRVEEKLVLQLQLNYRFYLVTVSSRTQDTFEP